MRPEQVLGGQVFVPAGIAIGRVHVTGNVLAKNVPPEAGHGLRFSFEIVHDGAVHVVQMLMLATDVDDIRTLLTLAEEQAPLEIAVDAQHS